jgi:thiol-disulfide isomerase/thioredoxin
MSRMCDGRRELRLGWRRMSLAGALLALTVLIGCAGEQPLPESPDITAVTLPDPATAEAFQQGVEQGYALLEEGKLDEALARFRQLQELVPASPYGEYHMACALGRNGKVEDALQSLRKAVQKGLAGRAQVEADPDLAGLASHASWPGLLSAMDENLRKQTARLSAPLEIPDPAQAPTFVHIDSLRSHYQQEARATYGPASLFPSSVGLVHLGRIAAREIAALERFKNEHAEPAIQYDADMTELRTATWLSRMGSPWVVGRDLATQVAGRILLTYPDSSGAGEAALWAAKADVAGLHDATDAITPDAAAQAATRLLGVADGRRGTPWEGAALAEAIWYQFEAKAHDLESVRPLVERLIASGQQDLRGLDRAYEVNEIVLRTGSARAFTATDIDGKVWTLDDLRGKVALLDFWATWCGPCRREIPGLVELAATYRPEELIILGVSLDTLDRMPLEQFRKWLAENSMTWPQIYEGSGWDGAIARLYGIPAIPFPVLLDAQGRVAAAGESARGEKLKEKVRELIGH